VRACPQSCSGSGGRAVKDGRAAGTAAIADQRNSLASIR
jgi:hypothetical protein